MTVTTDCRLLTESMVDTATETAEVSSGNSANGWVPSLFWDGSITIGGGEEDEVEQEEATWGDLAAEVFDGWSQENPF